MNKETRYELFRRLQAENPSPTTELLYTNEFELLIAVVLSAQATDKGVNKATRLLFPIVNTPWQIVELGEEGLKHFIKTINYYNTKAKNVIKLCEKIIALHEGKVPHTREALEALPGVGRKTANVILNTAFKEPTIAVDTHIFRVSNRTGLAKGKTVEIVEKKLMRVVPKEFRQDAHHWLILHGRYICVARKPKCDICPLYDLCEFKDKTLL